MRIKNLKIKNIGPFKVSSIDFISNQDEMQRPPVIILTGENGTGKTIIIDAIRTLLMGVFRRVEREITSSTDFSIESEIIVNGKEITLLSNSKKDQIKFETNNMPFNQIFHSQFEVPFKKDFVIEYWTSKLSNDSFSIGSIIALEPTKYLDDALNGVHKNVEVIKVITFFDYLRDSKNHDEKVLGNGLYNLLEQMINMSLGEGTLSHVSRIDLTPIVKIRNREISLDKLSSGNLYLVQRFTSVLRQVYSICRNNNIPISDYKKISGVLLIDEAENHLHPKWQKIFLGSIISLFPNFQLIVTTHSPFIVSSIENSRIYVCKSRTDHSVIEEETDLYSNKPVEEILMSPLFNTSNFNTEITDLLNKRKSAVTKGDKEEVAKIERLLLEKNPGYFNYLNIETLIGSIKK